MESEHKWSLYIYSRDSNSQKRKKLQKKLQDLEQCY
jgi:hypothetical protein